MALGTVDIENDLPAYEAVTPETPDPGAIQTTIGEKYTPLAEEQTTKALEATASNIPAYGVGETATQVNDYAKIDSGDSSVSQNSLLQNQLKSILDPNDELMMQAKSMGEASAARSGQLGSTAGMRTAQGSLYDRAIQIGSQDADTYAQAGRLAQQGKIGQQQTQTEAIAAGTLGQQDAAIYERKAALNNAFQTAIKSADQETAALLTDQQKTWDMANAQLNNDFQEWSTRYQVSSQMKENMLNRMSEAQLNHQIVMQELLGDPSFLELGGSAISNLMNTMVGGVSASIKSSMVASGYASTDPGLNDMLDNWVDEMSLINYGGI